MRRMFDAILATPLVLLLLATACATPGQEVALQPGDFALVEIQLRG